MKYISGNLEERETKGFCAVVESGSCDPSYTRWEERKNCGHHHRSIDAAQKCGEKHYAAKFINGSWQASAAWHGYRIHDAEGRRIEK